MNKTDTNEGAWLGTLARVGEGVLGLARNRLELFSVELQEEEIRTLNAAIWIAAALVLVAVGLFIALGAIAVCLWTIGGYFGLIGLAVISLSAGIGILVRIRNKIQSGPPPFSETIEQFRKDHACLLQHKSGS